MFSSRSSALGTKATHQVDKGKYDVLSDDADITLLGEQLKRSRESRGMSRVILGLSMSFVVASIGAIVYLSLKLDHANAAHGLPPTIMHTGSELGDCGNSIEDARMAGCKFDPMSWLWLPDACYQPHIALIDEWKSQTEWVFYSDVAMQPKDVVSVHSVFNGDHRMLYTPYIYHKVHCSYMWRKTHSILTQHLPIDDNTLSWHHMNHCQMVLLDEFFHEDVNCTNTEDNPCPIRLWAQFTKCGYFG